MNSSLNWHELLAAAEHLAGFVIVLGTLALLWGLTSLMGSLLQPRSAPVATPAAAPAAAPAQSDADLSEEEVVVLAATVATMLDARHRIVSVMPVQSSWGQQGRRDIHASHRIR